MAKEKQGPVMELTIKGLKSSTNTLQKLIKQNSLLRILSPQNLKLSLIMKRFILN